MKLHTSPSEILKSHFEKMKEVLPEVYEPKQEPESNEQKLFALMRRSLTIIEAVYFQNREMFTSTRVDEYAKIVEELKQLGHPYKGNEELMEKATAVAIMTAKMPMEKAKGARKKKSGSSSAKKAM